MSDQTRADEVTSWTDNLPVCPHSGIGFSSSRSYRKVQRGETRSLHTFEDKSFYYQFDNGTCLYGIFDGNNGVLAAEYVAKHIATEILLDLKGDENDQQIVDILRNAIAEVERSFFEKSFVADLLAERASILMRIEGTPVTEIKRKCPALWARLEEIDQQISSGTTVLIALVFRGYLYIANLGDSRAVLCELSEGDYFCKQQTNDHSLENESERDRLTAIGLKLDLVKLNAGLIVSQRSTRCLGNYFVKAGHSEYNSLLKLKEQPVLSEPEIMPPIKLGDQSQFLTMASNGVNQAVKQILTAHGAKHSDNAVNACLSSLILTELASQSTLCGVAQAVVDHIVRLHQDCYITGQSGVDSCEDMTLFVRVLKYPFEKTHKEPKAHVWCCEQPASVEPPSAMPDMKTAYSDWTKVEFESPEEEDEDEEEGRISPYIEFGDLLQKLQL
ncbi:TGF-beta-activated kinase 1 and MAP3K7-binding protein 1 [Halotydeus destructor]|nr:TGF-beta-activated kinase 1 and MAP3K7-binding protein 1 [Halotydeus destructor]